MVKIKACSYIQYGVVSAYAFNSSRSKLLVKLTEIGLKYSSRNVHENSLDLSAMSGSE